MTIHYLADSSRAPSTNMVQVSPEPPGRKGYVVSRSADVVIERGGSDDLFGVQAAVGSTAPVPAQVTRHVETPQPPVPQQIVVPQTQHVLAASPVQPPSKPPRKRVRLSNEGMGKMIVFVDDVAVSSKLVILAYDLASESTIVEPPNCSTDNPVFVEYDGQTYPCIFGGWTAEMGGRLMVVLVRIVQ